MNVEKSAKYDPVCPGCGSVHPRTHVSGLTYAVDTSHCRKTGKDLKSGKKCGWTGSIPTKLFEQGMKR